MDPQTGKTESPVGLAGKPEQGVVAYGAAWVAAGPPVERFDLADNRRQLIQMPRARLCRRHRRRPGDTFALGQQQRPPAPRDQ